MTPETTTTETSTTETSIPTDAAATETAMDGSAANAWEEQLIADIRANNGRPSDGPLKGHPLLLLYARGARTGEWRRAILTHSRDGNDHIVAATAGGSQSDPAWYRNISVDPEVEVEIGTERFAATATEETGAERDRLWKQHVEQLPWFADYPAQITERDIPVVRLSRKTPAG